MIYPLILLIILILVIFVYIRKDKDQIFDSFSLGEFLKNNNLVNENKSIVSQINDFFDTDSDDGDGSDTDDGGE
ncbi:hypothetical protein E2K98_24800 [Bacillus salipaludis]|uniref:Uncharacterized protein n=1 Tax=Bacillus salipaludis TaxID=2547811 RepID=A0A4R5VJT3_9BACI|nr:hypothetical protein [Bacillus salipaludis]TDK58139.1 hypothetical protein E2K98_24800 [Bacillus salipaludis]